MQRIKYNAELMKTMSLFETLTHTDLKDCFVDENELLVFVVEQDVISRSIGRNGQHVKHLENLLNRKIKIVGFTPDMLQFVRNVVYPLQVRDVRESEGVITITGSDTQVRGLLIGRNGKNLKNFVSIIQRYFEGITEVKVI